MIVLATNPRVGSTTLASALGSTGVLGHAEEYAHPEWVMRSCLDTGFPSETLRGRLQRWRARLTGSPDWANASRYRRASLRHYLQAVAASHSTPNGVFGIKLHFEHARDTLERHDLWVDLWQAPVFWVRLRRRDRLAQAVSLAIALDTKQWRPHQPPQGAPQYSPDRLEGYLSLVEEWDAGWDSRLGDLSRREVVDVWMEDLIAEPGTDVARVLALVDEHGAYRPQDNRSSDRSPHSDLRSQWIEKLLEERPELANRRWNR